MRIIVRSRGYAKIKPPVEKFIEHISAQITSNAWLEYLSNQDSIKAVNLLDCPLIEGEYDANLVWQYYSISSHGWFDCKDPRHHLARGLNVRLVFVKKYITEEELSKTAKVTKSISCKKCGTTLFKDEEELGLCGGCKVIMV